MPCIRNLSVGFFVLLACSGVIAQTAQTTTANKGGHFRYATMFWRAVETNPPSNTVEITLESAWRRSYSSGQDALVQRWIKSDLIFCSNYFTAAQSPDGTTLMQINGKESPVLELGDGMMKYLESVRITAWSEAEDWFLGEQVFTHTYNTPSNQDLPWVVKFKGCCRMSTLRNNPDASWDIQMHIDLIAASKSPRIVSLPVIYAQRPAQGLPQRLEFDLRTAMTASAQWMLPTPGVNAPAAFSALNVSLGIRGNVSVSTQTIGLLHIVAYAMDPAVPRIAVPVDLIVNITESAFTDPVFSGEANSLFAVEHRAYPGFELRAEISGYIRQSSSTSLFVGFTVGPLPTAAHLSTVRGKGTGPSQPAVMTFSWIPCHNQLGINVVCFDVVNNFGVAASQKCLTIRVGHDVPPTINAFLGGTIIEQDSVRLYIGQRYMFMIQATDMNPQDVLRIRPSTREGMECTPPDCLPIPPTSMMTQQIDRRESNMVTSSVTVAFTPAHNHGGYRMTHCFQVSDSCAGGCERNGETCPGMPQSAVGCVVIQVERCQFTVRKGQELQQIAAIYHTDWLQLWSHNQQLLSPDVNLEPGSLINIGHVYAVQPFDTPAAVGQRFGMTPEKFNTLNADVGMGAMQMEVCTSVEMCSSVRWCILPDSCDGQSGSIYQEAYADQPWFASAKDSLSYPPRPGTHSAIPAK